MTPPRVVLDTNVWIAGLLWRGDPYHCLRLAYAGLVKPLYCQAMLAELSIKLRESFHFSENRIEAVAYDFRRLGELVEVIGDLRVVAADPDDDKFIECAVSGGATVIISSDRHLLGLGSYGGVRILTALQFLSEQSTAV
jgi:putative PIN family toxin of toxin-antitoxin system